MSDLNKLNIRFEIHNMGLSFFIPIFTTLITSIYVGTTIYEEGWEYNAALAFEYLVCPFAAWWVSYLYYDTFEDNNEELLISLPISTKYFGIFRSAVFFLFFLLLLAIQLYVLNIISEIPLNIPFLLFRFASQGFVYAGLAFVLMMLFKNIMVPILAIVVFLSISFFSGGRPFVLTFSPLTQIDGEVFAILWSNIIIGFLFFVLGHLLLKFRMRNINS
ncbi:hypothetical protein [Lysinibacillus sp. Bpr_S20]|uniref:hypothetical protein n=1 Tax=Lysinibacillus sp. Bpr_S20 TaxID=2933964 RepID=UPI0020132DBA|nr:hypothetical protein [Lysinibacillus sp. Bpr_S20]MCL1699099.1 hypothetical protein [Lysinibacillus sp. Bpr_S20]